MSEEKPLLEQFIDWLSGLFTPKSSVEDYEETIPESEIEDIAAETPDEKQPEVEERPRKDYPRDDPRLRGLR